MPRYRATFRYGGSHPQYHMVDLDAADLRGALRAAAEELTDEVAETAELVEIRAQADPDEREYVEE